MWVQAAITAALNDDVDIHLPLPEIDQSVDRYGEPKNEDYPRWWLRDEEITKTPIYKFLLKLLGLRPANLIDMLKTAERRKRDGLSDRGKAMSESRDKRDKSDIKRGSVRWRARTYEQLVDFDISKVQNYSKWGDDRNGTYRLKVEPIEKSGRSHWFSVRLTIIQETLDGVKRPNIVWPCQWSLENREKPRHSDLIVNDDIIECKSISQMMGATQLKKGCSPAKWFNLDQYLSLDDEDDDAQEEAA